MITVLRRWLGTGVSFFLIIFSLGLASSSQAGTIVRVSTTMGDYSIELLDELTPKTVQNFLNYVNRNDYNGSYLHRVIDNFVVQGGGYRFQLFVGPIDIVADPPVENEFSASNIRGSVTMAKVEGDPNSATSQWFVNLADNSANLDVSNGGFTVFGNVLGDGMLILDAIDDLPIVELGTKASNAPYFTATYNNPLDLTYINVEVVDRYSEASHVFETSSGLLITSVDVDNGTSVVSLNFNAQPSETEVILQINLESVIPRRDSFEGIATFSTTDNRLRIPVLEVNLNGSLSAISNVVFVLSDPALGRFILESWDE